MPQGSLHEGGAVGAGGKVVNSAGSEVMVASGLNDPNLLAALAIPTAGSTYVVGQFAAYVCTCVAVPVPTVTLVAAVLII